MINNLITEMIKYYKGDPRRINHFMKVYAFAKAIGMEEGLDEYTQKILEAAAVVHDIGIKVSEEKYNSSAGKYQELEGPAVACDMLGTLGYSQDFIQRVCYLVGHHHTYDEIDGADYQILVEADFIVNIYEDGVSRAAIENIYEKIFKTAAGRKYLREMFL